ncbi:MAG: hypothetical protein AAB656_04455 [Patescibacteria group bacterium]
MTTLKQKLVASKMSENGGNIGKAMIAAGYSPATAKTPQKLTKSKGWLELMETVLPDKLLTRRHGKLLDAVRLDRFMFPGAVSDNEIKEIIESVPQCKLITVVRNATWATAHFIKPDYRIQLAAVELGYKVRGKLGNNKAESSDSTPHEEIEAFVAWVRKTLPM